MKGHESKYWQLVWFFSMDDIHQAALIGSTEDQWFIEESSKNAGANYLMGVVNALTEGWLPSKPKGSELRVKISEIADHFHPSYWCFESLSATLEWKQARCLAKELLDEEKPMVCPPKQPFKIENLIRVEHYQHASKIRGRVRWK